MKITKISIGILFALVAAGVTVWLPRPTTDEVMIDFHAAENRAEDMLMDPLILNTELFKHRVMNDVKNPGMDKRSYAIGFLGNQRITEAKPVLLQILNDESEREEIRGDALESIFQIDETRGRKLAKKYLSREDHIGEIARGLLDRSYHPNQRTWLKALIGWHD